ncbi:hypothetical protein AVEN_60374-1 [Araneus ventricosus]|uniref:Uncharacterized protein n=1 Tax=Araneus ventricosus TaxID=182803 RepID=A0A4Y2L5Q5_ARAVE|nr:hypothetical protein AVEN_190296-1 [Araneus ventricosus]GBN10085.1 hypothetical protein AVEN_60374-1 [Araneus ventricosus]
MQDAEKVQLCASTIHPSIYRSAFLISARPDQDPHRERECRQHKPSRIGDVQASVVVQMMIAISPEKSLSLAADFLHLKLHAAC